MQKKYIALSVSFSIILVFLIYCFYPIISYTSVNLPGNIFIYDRNGEIITDKSMSHGYQRDYEYEINPESKFIKSLIMIEDKNYYHHSGVNISSKLRALKDNLSGYKISGGSTITEQYIKNHYFQDNKRTYLQKLREIFISLSYSQIYSKDEVLQKYLNDVYLGHNIYGINGAINIFFGKSRIDELDDEEIVLLISLIHNPGIQSLEEKAFQKYFLKVKKRLGFIFERKIFTLNKKQNIDVFPFVTNEVISGKSDITISGTITQSSIDSKLQQFAKDIVNQTLEELKDKNVTNGAVYAMNPKTGKILVYLASRDFNSLEIDGQVDVIKSLRQPGSTIKPFLYLLALESGAHPDSLVLDIESEYNSFKKDKVYISENYSLKEYGLVRLKKALGNSFNNATVRLARELGLKKVYDYYKSYGFKLNYGAEHYGYSLVLGNPSIKLSDLVDSYSRLLPKKEEGGYSEKLLLYDILSDPDNRDVSFGVNSVLNTSIPQAVKTGTSSDFRDNLVVSYHPDLILGVWVGNNDNSSMQGVTGISGAGYIWHQVVEEAIRLGYIHEYEYDLPDDLEYKDYCLDQKCFRKENNLSRKESKYFSRLADNNYSSKDVFQKLTSEEMERLYQLGFEMSD